VEHFAATLAQAYLHSVRVLDADWRTRLKTAVAPRSDAAAWAVINVLPAHPIVTAPVAAAATRRSKPSIYEAIRQLQEAGVLLPLSTSPRNQSWEAAGLLDLLADLEDGRAP
jgi:hypothetical protein